MYPHCLTYQHYCGQAWPIRQEYIKAHIQNGPLILEVNLGWRKGCKGGIVRNLLRYADHLCICIHSLSQICKTPRQVFVERGPLISINLRCQCKSRSWRVVYRWYFCDSENQVTCTVGRKLCIILRECSIKRGNIKRCWLFYNTHIFSNPAVSLRLLSGDKTWHIPS